MRTLFRLLFVLMIGLFLLSFVAGPLMAMGHNPTGPTEQTVQFIASDPGTVCINGKCYPSTTVASRSPAPVGTVRHLSGFGGSSAIPPCKCGCMETGRCQCRNCAERTADPTWHPAPATFSNSAPLMIYGTGFATSGDCQTCGQTFYPATFSAGPVYGGCSGSTYATGCSGLGMMSATGCSGMGASYGTASPRRGIFRGRLFGRLRGGGGCQ